VCVALFKFGHFLDSLYGMYKDTSFQMQNVEDDADDNGGTNRRLYVYELAKQIFYSIVA